MATGGGVFRASVTLSVRAQSGRTGANVDKRTYADVTDTVILSVGGDILQRWTDFETRMFEMVEADPRQRFGRLLNVGSGRRIAESETEFFGRFAAWDLVEPDDSRRSALAEVVADRPADLHGVRVEDLATSSIPPADFVLCKYVLQHISSETVRPAVSALTQVTAPGGATGVFVAVAESEEPFFQLLVPIDAFRQMPRRLRRKATKDGERVSALIGRDQFDDLIVNGADFPFIATHHFGRSELGQAFPDFEMVGEDSGNAFLLARP